jgi:short-subunit dehydrogenase
LKRFWAGKSVFLTGASSGLGWNVVRALAPYGVRFGLLSRRREPVEKLVAELAGSNSTFTIFTADVRDRAAVERAIAEFDSQSGGIDVVWANSGVGRDSAYEKWNWENAENLIDTNVRGVVYTVHSALSHMVPRGKGAVVAISSVAAMRGLPESALYSATKVAVESYMNSLAIELPKIRFTTIFPGFVDTPINAHLGDKRLWVMTPQKAARLMISAVARSKAEYIYPFRMALVFKVARLAPAWLIRGIARMAMSLGLAKAT